MSERDNHSSPFQTPGSTAAGYSPDDDINASEVSARLAKTSPPPARIGGYRIIGILGEGGMGVVYEAVQLSLDRTVALKVVRSDLARKDAFVGRFLREAKVAARIDHPNVVTIYDTGEADGHLYMALQYVPGGDLSTRIKRDGRMDEDAALRIIAGCAKGLIAIHAAGLVHRDIKPSNIFLTVDGTPKIGDMGLARNIIDDEKLTFTGDLVGTPSYMAPEQAKGLADVDHRADLYALGTSLYHLLTGRPPFHGSSPFLIGHQVIAEVPPDPRELNRNMSPVVAAIIHHAMQKERSLRYQSAEELLVDIELVRTGRLPRFARVTVMDEERRASVTGSLARTKADDTSSAFTPVTMVLGMLAGIGLAAAVGIAFIPRSASAPTLPPLDNNTVAYPETQNQLPLFPASDTPPITPDIPNNEFLAANNPAEQPATLPLTDPIEPPAEPTPIIPDPQPTPPAAVPPDTVLPEPIPTPPTRPEPQTNPLGPITTAAPATEPTPSPAVSTPDVPPDAALRVVSEVVVKVPIDDPASSPTHPKQSKPITTGNNLRPLGQIPLTPAPVEEPAPTPPTPPTLVETPIDQVLTPNEPPSEQPPRQPVLDTSPAWASNIGGDRYGRWADFTVGTATIRFRLIPAGPAMIGSPIDEPGRSHDETQHRVVIPQSYWLSDSECPQLLWRAVMGDNPSSTSGDALPVDRVSFQNVQEFITEMRTLRPGVPVRLPSESEWESACRAASLGPYTGGLELRTLAWYRGTAEDRLMPIRRRVPNAYGLYDVHGNVWEWCQDVDRTYPPGIDGLPIAGPAFVYRGGSFASTAADCRAARRGGNQTGAGDVGIGFRLAISATMR